MTEPAPSPRSGIGIRSLSLMAIAAMCLVLGALAVYARATILDEDAFSARAVSTLHSDEVDEELADRLTDRLLVASPALVRWRPVVLDEAQRLTGTPGFATSFDAAARQLQHTLFADRYQLATFDVGPAETTLKRAVAERQPNLAARLRGVQASDLMDLSGGGLEGRLRDLAPTARELDILGVPLLLMTLVLLAGAVLLATDRRRGLHAAALVVGGTGVVLVAGWMAARAITLQLFDTSHGDAVVGQIWDAFLGDLRLWSLALAGAGIALAACIAATLPHGEPTRMLAAARAKLAREALRAPQALGLLVLAAIVLVVPEVIVDLFAVALAGGLLYCGVHQLARLAVR